MPGSSLRNRIIKGYKQIGVAIKFPQVNKLLTYTAQQKNIIESSRISRRKLTLVLRSFLESMYSPGRNLILSPELRSALTPKPLLENQKGHSLISLLADKRPDQVHVIAATPRTERRFRSRITESETFFSNVHYCSFSPSKDKPSATSEKPTPLKDKGDFKNLQTILSGESFVVF